MSPTNTLKIATLPTPWVDRAEWFNIDVEKRKLVAGQMPLLARLVALTNGC